MRCGRPTASLPERAYVGRDFATHKLVLYYSGEPAGRREVALDPAASLYDTFIKLS